MYECVEFHGATSQHYIAGRSDKAAAAAGVLKATVCVYIVTVAVAAVHPNHIANYVE